MYDVIRGWGRLVCHPKVDGREGRVKIVKKFMDIICESPVALGYMVGPPIGSALYQYGGFTTPFYVVGSLTALVAVVLVFLVPKMRGSLESGNDDHGTDSKPDCGGGGGKKLSLLEVVKVSGLMTRHSWRTFSLVFL